VDVLGEIAKALGKAVLGLRGAVCFQAIMTSSGPKVFEINARFGGGYPLAHAAGATFGKWLIQEALGMKCEASDEWENGVLMLRYDSAVYKRK
jgi:carbamoyl-phosphate synthase large subunit